MIKHRVFGRTLCVGAALYVAIAIASSGCGGSDGDSGSSAPQPTNTPQPTPTPLPGQFNGNYAGTVALDAGQTGTVSLMVQNGVATGTLAISGGATPETVPFTGTVDQIGGSFSTAGKSADGSISAVVSGMLPGPSAGFLAIQIGASLNPFRGTISPA